MQKVYFKPNSSLRECLLQYVMTQGDIYLDMCCFRHEEAIQVSHNDWFNIEYRHFAVNDYICFHEMIAQMHLSYTADK